MMAGVACGSCGTVLRESARFCHECGSPTAPSAESANYKQVTVLFADVVGSMDIAATVDAERLREIMTQLVERSAVVVRRFGGTVEYNGDGVMALFGAPVALEDHGSRACLAALAIQEEAHALAAEVQRRDGVALRVRVGLNSGRVIAGEIGSGALGYAAIGEAVGMAQRMESAAPPGEVLLSESTARLVEHTAVLSDPEWVRIKGADEPVRACRLVAVSPRDGGVGRGEAGLVGRRWEMAALDAIVERAIGGRGGVVNVVGPPGIGKSRAAREVAALAAGRGVEVFWAFCESHASDVPFYAVTRLLRAGVGAADLDDEAARLQLRASVPPEADPQDLLLLDHLVGIADPSVPQPQIDPDARRRRLTALINTSWLARAEPALFIVEDVHWIDTVSESMLVDFLTVVPRTRSVVLITARPEYEGALTRVHGAQTIALAPLDDSDTTTLLGELIGSHSSVDDVTAIVAERAGGNPFFAEEMVRELVQRGVLTGTHGEYVCGTDVAELNVPATVQAAIAARIDGLTLAARRTLNAASVIGTRFGAELVQALDIEPMFDELLRAELIDQVRFTPSAEYAFRHPLIGAVAYESQLKSDRAQWHRRLAAAIQDFDPGSVEDNASLIAQHMQAAGDLHDAYGWHMRAAAWAAARDFVAARVSWRRARQTADQLPDDDPSRLALRIAPSTMLCATDFHDPAAHESSGRFAELRELCSAAGDKVSLAIAMAGPAAELLYAGRLHEASRLASEQMALLESIGDPTLTIGLSFSALLQWCFVGDFGEMLRLSQTVVDLADGDTAKGAGFGIGSPLAAATALRGVARYWLGHRGWREDLDHANAMAQDRDPATLAAIVAWTYGLAIQHGTLQPDDSAIRVIEEAVHVAAGMSMNVALSLAEYTLGLALLSRNEAADRQRGLELMRQIRDMWLRESVLVLIPVADLWIARETARCGGSDGSIPVMSRAVDELHRAGALGYGVWGTDVLVEALLARGTAGDLTQAQNEYDRLAKLRDARGSAMLEITLLRLRALLARAHGDDIAFKDLAGRYRTMAESLAFEGHIDWAKAMTEATDT